MPRKGNSVSVYDPREIPAHPGNNQAAHNVEGSAHTSIGRDSRGSKISLIVPVYQEEKILEESLKVYTLEIRKKYDIELIVSDGGSVDGTMKIAGDYADKVVRHTSDHRQTIAEGRNAGAAVASGKVYVFINGDTVPKDPDEFFNFISRWADGDTKETECDALACSVYIAPDEILFKDKIFYNLHNLYVQTFNGLGIGMGRGECQIVKAGLFNNVGGYNARIVAGEDFDLYHRISKVGKIKFAREITVFESPRRFRKYGYLRILGLWTLNSVCVTLFGRSMSKEWKAVR